MTVIELLEREDYYSKVEILKDDEIIFSGSIDDLYEEERKLLFMSVLNYNFDLHMVINSRWYWDCTIEVE
jgi:hypothetical protein